MFLSISAEHTELEIEYLLVQLFVNRSVWSAQNICVIHVGKMCWPKYNVCISMVGCVFAVRSYTSSRILPKQTHFPSKDLINCWTQSHPCSLVLAITIGQGLLSILISYHVLFQEMKIRTLMCCYLNGKPDFSNVRTIDACKVQDVTTSAFPA